MKTQGVDVGVRIEGDVGVRTLRRCGCGSGCKNNGSLGMRTWWSVV